MLIETKRINRVILHLLIVICFSHIACTPDKVVVPKDVVVTEESSSSELIESDDMDQPFQDSLAENPKIDIISSEPELTSWVIPNVVIHKMGDLKGQTIADIGAGVGYFAFRLVKRDANVIAIDIDPTSIDLMNSIAFLNLDDNEKGRFETRLAEPNDPLLTADEVDKVTLMHLIGYIDDKQEYLVNLKKSIKKNGSLMIMDFKMKRLPDGYPTKEFRMYPDQLEELLYSIGYNQVEIDDTTLDYQYILTAVNPD